MARSDRPSAASFSGFGIRTARLRRRRLPAGSSVFGNAPRHLSLDRANPELTLPAKRRERKFDFVDVTQFRLEPIYIDPIQTLPGSRKGAQQLKLRAFNCLTEDTTG